MRRRTVISLTLSVLLLTACGGGDSASQKAAPGTPENPLQALPNPQPTRTPPTDETGVASKSKSKTKTSTSSKTGAAASWKSIVAAQKRAQARNTRVRAARAKAKAAATASGRGRGPRKQLAAAPSAQRPCSLVTKAQARRIVGVPIVEPLEAPQGPTCIYRSRAGKQLVTLTVQTTDFARLKSQARKLRTVSVSQRSAICGSYGRSMLYLPLAGGRVLSIAGSCSMASRFAAKAVPYL